MDRAVMYGAGKIGRGFIGKLFVDSGYQVCFLDNVLELVDAINERGQYTVRFVSNEASRDSVVKPVRAVYSLSEQAVREIVECDILATAVGVNELPNIAPVIARAMVARMEESGRPLDVILCENQIGAGELMRGWIYESLNEAQRAWADGHLGLVGASIGRMVPPVTEDMLREDRLLIRTEEHDELPVDRDAFRGELPHLLGLIPYSPFEFYIQRKLFVSNGGHALSAYLGYERGYEYIWQAVEDPEIHRAVSNFMMTCAQALVSKYGEEVRRNVEDNAMDMLRRFQNRALRDTVTRVGADPVRKLRRNDRLVGAALFIIDQGLDPAPVVKGILAALKYDNPEDPSAMKLKGALAERGIEGVLRDYMGLSPQEPLYSMVRDAYLEETR